MEEEEDEVNRSVVVFIYMCLRGTLCVLYKYISYDVNACHRDIIHSALLLLCCLKLELWLMDQGTSK